MSLLTLVVITFTYDIKIATACLFSILFNAIAMVSEVLCGFCVTRIEIDYVESFLLGATASKAVLLIFIMCLRLKHSRNRVLHELPLKYHMSLIIILSGCIWVMNNIYNLSYKLYGDMIDKNSLLSIIIMLLVIGIVFKLYISLSNEIEIKRYNAVYEQQIDLYDRHMREKERTMHEFRKSRHDMKQKMFVLLELVKSKNYDQSINYIEKMIGESDYSILGVVKTGNDIIDSLLNYKYSYAKEKGIKFLLDVNIPLVLPFRGTDLCIIIGNALDNAIEATEKVINNKFVNFYMKYEKSVLIIVISNSYIGKLKRNKEGSLETQKQDVCNHGIGLRSIKKTIEKYHGEMIYEIEANIFVLNIIMYSEDKKE